MCANQVLHFLHCILVLLLTSGWNSVSAMEVYTSGRVQVVNGTDVRLKCTFQSTHPVKPSELSISWSFSPLRPGKKETVFYYHKKPYPPTTGHFLNKVVFVGDVLSRDASILVRDVTYSYNGTFTCQVMNPPDVHGNVGEVQLRVVASAPFSEIVILAVAIGGAVLLAIVCMAVCIFVRRCREMNRMEQERLRRERKDLVVW